jgi:HAMP domain-containing protein
MCGRALAANQLDLATDAVEAAAAAMGVEIPGETRRLAERAALRAMVTAYREEARREIGQYSEPSEDDPTLQVALVPAAGSPSVAEEARPAAPPREAPATAPLASSFVEPFFERRKTKEAKIAHTIRQDRGTLKRFLEIVGDRPVTEYCRRDMIVFLETMRQIPANYGKSTRDKQLTAEQLIQRAEKEDADRLKDKTVKRHLSVLSQFFLVATGGTLEGQNVADRPWFRAGLQGPFAGDVHDAVLLQRRVAPNAQEPLRLIDLAGPVRRPDGTLLGVLGRHVSWVAVRDVIRGALRETGRDVLLVSRSGSILVGPEGLEGQTLSPPSILAAQQGASRTSVETWPNGETYVAAVIGPVAHLNLPSFGWSLVVRQPAAAAAAPAAAITRRLAWGFGIVALVVVIGSLLLGAAVARPLRRLRDSAAALADGRLNGPVPDLRGYQEVRAIADALTRIQARLPESARPKGEVLHFRIAGGAS